MGADLQTIDWMSPKTKEQALLKLHAVANKIGAKQKWNDYSSVKIVRDSYNDGRKAYEASLILVRPDRYIAWSAAGAPADAAAILAKAVGRA